MKQYGSQNMIAPLQKVLVKRPEEAFAVDDPAIWHYAGRPDLPQALQEHDDLVALLWQAGAEVIYHDGTRGCYLCVRPGYCDRSWSNHPLYGQTAASW